MQLKYNLTYIKIMLLVIFFIIVIIFLIYQLVRILLCISTLTFYSGNHCYVNILHKKNNLYTAKCRNHMCRCFIKIYVLYNTIYIKR